MPNLRGHRVFFNDKKLRQHQSTPDQSRMRTPKSSPGFLARLYIRLVLFTTLYIAINSESLPKTPEYGFDTNTLFETNTEASEYFEYESEILTAPETESLLDSEEPIDPSPPPASVATAPGLITTQNFILNERKRVFINANYVNLLREINVDNLDILLNKMTIVQKEHQKICMQIASSIASERYMLSKDPWGDSVSAKEICERQGYKLPEVKDLSDNLELLSFLLQNKIDKTYTTARYSRSKKTLVYSDQSIATNNIQVCDSPPHKNDDISYWYYYNNDLISRPNAFSVTPQNTLKICHINHEILRVVCEKNVKVDIATRQNLDHCNSRTVDISSAITPLRKTIKLLHESLFPTIDTERFQSPHNPITTTYFRNKRDTTPQTPIDFKSIEIMQNLAPFNLTRYNDKNKSKKQTIVKRFVAQTTLFASFISVLISLISYLSTNAQNAESSTKIGRLQINTNTIASEIDNLTRNVFSALDHTQEQQYLRSASQSTYSTFLRILLTLQDSILSFKIPYNL